MTCKNCETSLRTDFMFCPSCGSKTDAGRITFKKLWADVKERFFDLDNTFFRTVKTMTFRPEEVVGLYIDGVRRRFMNPMSYLGVALGLSGILFFIMQKIGFLELLDFEFLGSQSDVPANGKVMDVIMEYQTFVFLMYIPVIAFAGILSFNSRGYNLPEHFVTAIYTLAHISIITFPISLVIILFAPSVYMGYSFFNIFLMVLFSAFVLIRLHPYKNLGIILIRALIFAVLWIVGYFAISIGIHALLLLSGVVELSDYLPQKT